MLSIQFTRSQVLKLKQRGIKKFYLLFDNEEKAQKRAKELEKTLVFAEEVCYIELETGIKDPAELLEFKKIDDLRDIKQLLI